MAAMGVHITEHEPDGSADPNAPPTKETKQSEAAKRERGSYQTRAATSST